MAQTNHRIDLVPYNKTMDAETYSVPTGMSTIKYLSNFAPNSELINALLVERDLNKDISRLVFLISVWSAAKQKYLPYEVL